MNPYRHAAASIAASENVIDQAEPRWLRLVEYLFVLWI
jgi:hypothetical protein